MSWDNISWIDALGYAASLTVFAAERLVVDCSGCRQSKHITWEAINRPPETLLADLTGRLVCQRCGENGPMPRIVGVSH